MSFLDDIIIMNEVCPCFVHCYKFLVANSNKKGKIMVSTFEIDKALRNGGEVFFIIIAYKKSN
jgi:hypothetical protein